MNLESHLSEMPATEAEALRLVLERLRQLPQRIPSAGLQDRVMQAVRAERTRCRRQSLWQPAAMLAAGLLILATLVIWRQSGDLPGDADTLWLARQQAQDGSWNPALSGGDPAYRPALTALAALALAQAPDAPRWREQISRACHALHAMQNHDGTFGGAGRVQSYNQAIATYALGRLLPYAPATRPALDAAVARGSALQSAEGGWDYENNSSGNAALTAWQVRAMAAAAGHGVAGAHMPLRKGLLWLRGMTREDGSVAYHRNAATTSEGLTALAAHTLISSGAAFEGLPELGRRMVATLSARPGQVADCYRDYARTLAFASSGARAEARSVRQAMLARLRAGESDQWDKVGGALYTHALAALSTGVE